MKDYTAVLLVDALHLYNLSSFLLKNHSDNY